MPDDRSVESTIQGMDSDITVEGLVFDDSVTMGSYGNISTSLIAKEFGIPASGVHRMLAEDGYIVKLNTHNTWAPTTKLEDTSRQRRNEPYTYAYVSAYRFVNDHTGMSGTQYNLKWTNRGALFLRGYLKSKLREKKPKTGFDDTDIEGLDIVDELLNY